MGAVAAAVPWLGGPGGLPDAGVAVKLLAGPVLPEALPRDTQSCLPGTINLHSYFLLQKCPCVYFCVSQPMNNQKCLSEHPCLH